MRSIVSIYSGPPEARVLEGKAELVEVAYKGHGLYLARCIFVDDPQRCVQTREYNIVEQMGLGERISIAE